MICAIRGATTAKKNTADSMLSSTKELLSKIVELNQLESERIISAFFTATPDLNAAFPAAAARELGWNDIPLMCAVEINVEGSLEKCIRVMIHVDIDKPREQVKHVYLNEAKRLRPDINNEVKCEGNCS